MSLMQLVSRFTELEKELQEAVRVNDIQRIGELDAQIAECFEQILDHAPADAFERKEKCSFLIEQLSPSSNRQGIEDAICNKILELVSNSQDQELAKVRSK